MSYFNPVLPDETGETVVGKLQDDKVVRNWNVPLPLPLLESDLLECSEAEGQTGWQNQRTTFNSKDCQERGQKAEKLFIQKCAEKGWNQKFIKEAKEYDYKFHVDAMFKVRDNFEMWVDVKCCRAMRYRWPEQGEYMWVELNNTGWLFGGKATVIAQQVTPNTFCLFDRLKLCDYVKHNVLVQQPVVPYPEQAYLRVYLRISPTNGFRHLLSVLKVEDAFKECGCGILY